MAKKKTKKSKPAGQGRFRAVLGSLAQRHGGAAGRTLTTVVLLAAMAAVLCVVGAEMRKRNLLRRQAGNHVRWHVTLANRPAWMPPQLADMIAAGITPKNGEFSQESLCRDIAHLAERLPWISSLTRVEKIRVDAKNGAVKVFAKYREPFARVRYDRRFYFVDSAGVVLPGPQVPQYEVVIDGRVHYIIDDDSAPVGSVPYLRHFVLIDGTAAGPLDVGKLWPGDDLQAGLKLIRLINTRTYARQISVVDIRNFGQRVSDTEPELRMYAQLRNSRPTDIRFGRFPRPEGGDWVKSPDEKLQYLDEYVADHGGRLAGINSYIDVRFGELRISLN